MTAGRHSRRHNRFWRTSTVVFALIVLINYAPVFYGKIPFPRDVLLRHSAWNGQPQEQTPELIDIVAMFYPFRALIGRAAEELTLPLWNPHIMSGAPFQANAQSALFSPLNLFYYILPTKAAWTAGHILRLFLAAMFMALFVRSVGASAAGSLVSGILFALCGHTIQWQGMSNGDSSIWLPLMCYAVHRLHLEPNGRSTGIAALAFPLPLLAGHPETAAHSAGVAAALAVFLWIFPHASRVQAQRRGFVFGFVLAGVLAVGLSSIQLIPTLEWLSQAGLKVDAPEPVLDRHQGQGLFSRDISRNPSSAGLRIPEASAYVGMTGLLAAGLALFSGSRRYVYFLIAIAVVAAAVAYGVAPLRWLIVHIPIVKAMKHGRLTLALDFALAALAGLGITALEQPGWAHRVRRRAMAFTAVLFGALCFCIYEVHRATLTPVALWKSPMASFIFLTAAAIVIAARLRVRLGAGAFSVLISGVAAVEMMSFSYGYTGFSSPDDVFPRAPVFDFIAARDRSAPFRVAKDRFPIPHNAGMIYGFDSADGYDLTTERARAFTSGLIEEREDGIMFLAENLLASRDRRLDMLNVKYVMVSKPGRPFELMTASDRFVPVFSQDRIAVFENKRALPRFFTVAAAGIEIQSDAGAQLARLKAESFDPERSVIFSDPPAPLADAASQEPARVQLVESTTNGHRLRVDCSAPTVLVVSQMYYPGWRATIDGSVTPVYPVDLALTGLMVPAGSHEIAIFFWPAAFEAGLVISLVSVVAVVVLLPRRFSFRRGL